MQLQPLHQLLVRAARTQRLVLAASHPQRPQAGLAEAVGDRRVREGRELAERAHPEALELLRQVGRADARRLLGSACRSGAVAGQPLAEQAHRQGGEEGARHRPGDDHGRPARPRAEGAAA